MNWNLPSWQKFTLLIILVILIAVSVVLASTSKGFGCPDDTTITSVTNHGPYATKAACDTARVAQCVNTTVPAANAACNAHCASQMLWKCIGESTTTAKSSPACFEKEEDLNSYYNCTETFDCVCI